MKPTVKEVSQGSNLRWGDSGWEDTLVYTVSGLSGSTSQKRYDAALLPDIPQRGAPHPYIPNIVARSCPGVEMPKGHTFARITINFGVPEEGDGGGGGGGSEPDGSGISIRGGTIYERVPSNFAVNADGSRGSLIALGWDPAAEISLDGDGYSPPPSGGLNTTNTQLGTIDTYAPRPTLIFAGKADTMPLSRSLKVGRTNADNFLAGIAGRFDGIPAAMQEPDTWMLIRQSFESRDGGQTVSVEREVAFRPDKWYGVAVFIDPTTGQPPANIGRPQAIAPGQRANGVLVVRAAGQDNFEDLLEF